jgi:hypothetical protein
MPIQIWLGMEGFVSFLQQSGRRYVNGGLGMRDTSIELKGTTNHAGPGWGDLSQDWTFEFEIYDNKSHGRRGVPPEEYDYNFWFVLTPMDRDLYERYRPKQKSSWQTHQRMIPIYTFKDRKTGVAVDVYDEFPWEKHALKRNPSSRTFADCANQVAWWIAMADFSKWVRRSAASSSIGGVIDYISSWRVPGARDIDISNFLEAGSYGGGPGMGPVAGLPGTIAGFKGSKPIVQFWALNAPPSSYYYRKGMEHKYVDPIWNSPNGELWIYTYDPWDFLAA